MAKSKKTQKFRQYSIRTWKDFKTKKPTKYYVAVNHIGNVISRRKISSAKMNFQNAIETHKKTGTFFTNKYHKVTKLGFNHTKENFSESIKTSSTTIEKRHLPVRKTIPKGTISQYVVEGDLTYTKKFSNGHSSKVTERICARSQNIRNKDADYNTTQEAKQRAWESFFERIHFISNGSVLGNYDADEGLKIAEKNVSNIREGWVSYQK